MPKLHTVFILTLLAANLVRAQGIITTIAGNGSISVSGDGGLAISAGIGFPAGVAVDGFGNVYIADWLGDRVRKVLASNGTILTVAGGLGLGFAPVSAAPLPGPTQGYRI